MEQTDVCNSWEEFDDDSKLLEQQLEKLKIQKARPTLDSDPEKETSSREPSTSKVPEETPKMRILKRNEPAMIRTEVTSAVAAGSTNGVSNGIVIQDESMRTQYVPPEPRISILSRPKSKSSQDSSASNGNRSKSKNQPPKTLEQREQEYAEARKRIFGGDAVETS